MSIHKPSLERLLTNRNNHEKKSDKFYVSFFNVNENLGNYLGAQVISVTRPNVTIEDITHGRRGNTYNDTGRILYDPIEITFADDEESVTSMLLYAQMLRQKKKFQGKLDNAMWSSNADGENYRFGLQYEMLNSRNEVTEGYILNDCYIRNITHSNLMYSDETSNTITVSVIPDNINIKILDEYFPFT